MDNSTRSLMTLQQASKYIGVHEMTLYRWAKKGTIPAIKIGGRWRIKKELIDSKFDGYLGDSK